MLNTLVTTSYLETHSTESYREAMMNVCYPGSSHDALEQLAKDHGSSVLTELGQYLFMSSLMAISFLCSLGPVWYHPTIRSLAKKQKLSKF